MIGTIRAKFMSIPAHVSENHNTAEHNRKKKGKGLNTRVFSKLVLTTLGTSMPKNLYPSIAIISLLRDTFQRKWNSLPTTNFLLVKANHGLVIKTPICIKPGSKLVWQHSIPNNPCCDKLPCMLKKKKQMVWASQQKISKTKHLVNNWAKPFFSKRKPR